jgi:esterase/lipase
MRACKHKIIRNLLTLFGMLILLSLSWGCNLIKAVVSESYPVVEEEIEFTNDENIVLVGTLFDSGYDDLLAHSGVLGEDQTGLHPLAKELAKRGSSSLTFDFQGIGKTGGETAFEKVDKDVKAAMTALRERGFVRIACIGVGLGGIACAKSGKEPNMAGLVLVSSPIEITTGTLVEEPELQMIVNTLEIVPEDLKGLNYPILIIVAEDDKAAGRPFAEMAQTIYDFSSEPKEIKVFPGSYHSMELFRSEHGNEINNLIIDFIERIR